MGNKTQETNINYTEIKVEGINVRYGVSISELIDLSL